VTGEMIAVSVIILAGMLVLMCVANAICKGVGALIRRLNNIWRS